MPSVFGQPPRPRPAPDRPVPQGRGFRGVTITNLAIRTGRTFTVVTVDTEANQCLVDHIDTGRLYFIGTHERVIRRAAMDAGGVGFRTLREAMASREGANGR